MRSSCVLIVASYAVITALSDSIASSRDSAGRCSELIFLSRSMISFSSELILSCSGLMRFATVSSDCGGHHSPVQARANRRRRRRRRRRCGSRLELGNAGAQAFDRQGHLLIVRWWCGLRRGLRRRRVDGSELQEERLERLAGDESASTLSRSLRLELAHSLLELRDPLVHRERARRGRRPGRRSNQAGDRARRGRERGQRSRRCRRSVQTEHRYPHGPCQA